MYRNTKLSGNFSQTHIYNSYLQSQVQDHNAASESAHHIGKASYDQCVCERQKNQTARW